MTSRKKVFLILGRTPTRAMHVVAARSAGVGDDAGGGALGGLVPRLNGGEKLTPLDVMQSDNGQILATYRSDICYRRNDDLNIRSE